MFAIIVSRAIFLALFFFLFFFFCGRRVWGEKEGVEARWKRSSLGLYSMDHGTLACKCFLSFFRVIYISRSPFLIRIVLKYIKICALLHRIVRFKLNRNFWRTFECMWKSVHQHWLYIKFMRSKIIRLDKVFNDWFEKLIQILCKNSTRILILNKFKKHAV